MIKTPKKMIQAVMVAGRHRAYEQEVARQRIPYETWIKDKMQEKLAGWKQQAQNSAQQGNTLPAVGVVSYSQLAAAYDSRQFLEMHAEEILLFAEDPGKLVPEAAFVIGYFFASHADCGICYPDELAWLKPDWSPDTLQSFFYFGHVFAVRRSCIEAMQEQLDSLKRLPEQPDGLHFFLYAFVLTCLDHTGSAAHLSYMLYQGEKDHVWGYGAAFDAIRAGHRFSDPSPEECLGKVSVIIASKDHPALLSHCIHSIREFTDYRNVEIIVVDNGSNDENRARIERMRDQAVLEASFSYYYEVMPFNFSRMCNIGASHATGDFLLFLNDDTEAVQPRWLGKMVAKAAKPYIGAVGVKLLYPDGKTIQHAGVTNIHLGPAHKLQIASDLTSHYYGWNRNAVNCAAVTGACLLVRREVFDQAGGWKEELEVAFNDVELCYRIRELGYQNVCCNDTWMLHHESVSRGSDEGKHKLNRLHRERDILYGLHPTMWNHDPYYNEYLEYDMMDRGFETGNRYSEKNCSRKEQPVSMNGQLQPQMYNQVLCSGIEFAGDASLWRTGTAGSGDYYIQGWFYALQVDNSRYKLNLLLRRIPEEQLSTDRTQDPSGDVWKVPFTRCYRPDREECMPFIDHPALSGMSVWIDRNALPAGEYLLGYLWEDTCSRQKMYDFTAETLNIV